VFQASCHAAFSLRKKPLDGIGSALRQSENRYCAVSLNSPFTAADEKIPLSVVRVNRKPQHLVFCCRFGHLNPKHGHLPVESLKQPCAPQVCAV
jgi:hypothetical protein